MKRAFYIIGIVTAAIISASCTNQTQQNKNHKYYVAAFVWPSCHNDSLAQAHLWANGEGEWEVCRPKKVLQDLIQK